MKKMGPKTDPWVTLQEKDKVEEQVEPEMIETSRMVDGIEGSAYHKRETMETLMSVKCNNDI